MNKIIIVRLAILSILILVLFMKFYLLKFFKKSLEQMRANEIWEKILLIWN